MASKEFLHLTNGPSAARVVSEALGRLGRNETVLYTNDALTEGPLHDVDGGGAARKAWWARLHDGEVQKIQAVTYDDSELWSDVRSATTDVVLWHGLHPMERMFALRACWHLRDHPERVHEVALVASGAKWGSTPRPVFYDSVPLAGPDEITKAWSGCVRVPVAELATRASRWEAIRAVEGDWLHRLEGDQIVRRPVTAYDDDLLSACSGGWTASLTAVGMVVANNPATLDLFVWRLRELLRAGALEGRGDTNRIGLPDEIRLKEQ